MRASDLLDDAAETESHTIGPEIVCALNTSYVIRVRMLDLSEPSVADKGEGFVCYLCAWGYPLLWPVMAVHITSHQTPE